MRAPQLSERRTGAPFAPGTPDKCYNETQLLCTAAKGIRQVGGADHERSHLDFPSKTTVRSENQIRVSLEDEILFNWKRFAFRTMGQVGSGAVQLAKL